MFTSAAGAEADAYPAEKIKILYRILGSLPFTNSRVSWEHNSSSAAVQRMKDRFVTTRLWSRVRISGALATFNYIRL